MCVGVCLSVYKEYFGICYKTDVYVLLHLTGCKIKALRAKTNTYIKTPVRGEEPVFIVTGRREDVEMAKREIVSAAEHFSMIRASRCKAGGSGGGGSGGSSLPGPPHLPGQTTIQVPPGFLIMLCICFTLPGNKGIIGCITSV